jgi:hypothetical protein
MTQPQHAVPANLRGGLSDLINTLNKVRNNSGDPDLQLKIQKLLRVLYAIWEEVIAQTIDATTPAYRQALTAIGRAETSAKRALADLRKTAAAIRSAVRAAKAVDRVIKLFVSVGL